jgi:hypothetical protein
LRRSGRKPTKTVREEKTQKEIMMGSQKTIEKVMGTDQNPPKSMENQYAFKRRSIQIQ